MGPTSKTHLIFLNQTLSCVAAGEPHPQPHSQMATKAIDEVVWSFYGHLITQYVLWSCYIFYGSHCVWELDIPEILVNSFINSLCSFINFFFHIIEIHKILCLCMINSWYTIADNSFHPSDSNTLLLLKCWQGWKWNRSPTLSNNYYLYRSLVTWQECSLMHTWHVRKYNACTRAHTYMS